MIASCVPPTEDLAYNPGMCPDWESNQPPFDSQAGTCLLYTSDAADEQYIV